MAESIARSSVLVVGGTSFIGSHLLPRLAERFSTVFATCRPGATPSVARGVQWVACDLAAADPTGTWPKACDAVVYLAQSREWRRFPDGAADVFAVNVHAFYRALEYARLAGARQFVFASSGSIYDRSDAPARESDAIRVADARQLYVASKLNAELLLGAYAQCFRATALRLFVPYGRGQGDDMLVPRLLRRVRDGQPIQVNGEDGLRINPVAVADVADAFVRCLEAGAAGTLNVAGPEVLTLREIGHRIGEAVGRDPLFEPQAGPAPTIVGETSMLRAALGWAPTIRFREGLRALCQHAAD